MTIAAQVVFGMVVLLIVIQGALVARFVMALWNWKRELIQDQDAPQATIVLALRGRDPFLETCLECLLNQDYPNYDVVIVVDHPRDPAREVARKAVDSNPDSPARTIRIEILNEPASNRSLKCSCLIQAVESLEADCKFIALVDADTSPHPSWLRELATALDDEQVAAATGNRWYMPSPPTAGALVRHVWNAAAAVQMYSYRIPWGGTLAIKTKTIREANLLAKWGQAFCEDTMMFPILKSRGLRVEFVPSLIMLNREQCTLADYFHWVQRQLFTARLYHPAWPAVLGHGLITTFLPALAFGLAGSAWIGGQREAFCWAATALIVYQSAISLMLLPMEYAVRRIARARKESTDWLPIFQIWKYAIAVLGTQIIYFPALVTACFVRQIKWRGVIYSVRGPWRIELQEYRPYQEAGKEHDSHSL